MSFFKLVQSKYTAIAADDHAVDIEKMLSGYLTAMLWSTRGGEEDEPLDEDHSVEDVSSELEKSSTEDCEKFVAMAKEKGIDLGNYVDSDVGHDFWLTRVGHGAGFWDGDYEADEAKEDGDKLTEIAKTFGNLDPYVGDDGKIYAG